MQYYERIENIRVDNDIKQYELARMIGIDKKKYSSYETGTRGMPLDILDKTILILNVSLDYILGLTDYKGYDDIKSINLSNLPSNLRNFRKSINLTQEEFANNVHIKQQTISNYESGKSIISIENLIIICKYYNISADLLTGRVENVDTLIKPKEK